MNARFVAVVMAALTAMKPENLALIRKLYPQDEATDFKFGEPRGLRRIEFQPAA